MITTITADAVRHRFKRYRHEKNHSLVPHRPVVVLAVFCLTTSPSQLDIEIGKSRLFACPEWKNGFQRQTGKTVIAPRRCAHPFTEGLARCTGRKMGYIDKRVRCHQPQFAAADRFSDGQPRCRSVESLPNWTGRKIIIDALLTDSAASPKASPGENTRQMGLYR